MVVSVPIFLFPLFATASVKSELSLQPRVAVSRLLPLFEPVFEVLSSVQYSLQPLALPAESCASCLSEVVMVAGD